MTRWRLTATLPGVRGTSVRKHWRTSCKLCAILKCMELARECADANHVPEYTVHWTVEKLAGVVDGWDIVYTSSMPRLTRAKRHAHN